MSKEELKAKLFDEKVFEPLVDDTFASADIDKSGFVDKKELKIILADIAKQLGMDPPNDTETEKEMQRLDKNKDGKISKQEFRDLVKELLLTIIEAM